MYGLVVRWSEDLAERVGDKHVQIFLPSVDRKGNPVPQGQGYWVEECLRVMGEQFGGATAFPPSRGVWRDDDNGGNLIYDDTVVVFSYVASDDLTGEGGTELLGFAKRLGRETRQGEVGIYVDGRYFGIRDFEERT